MTIALVHDLCSLLFYEPVYKRSVLNHSQYFLCVFRFIIKYRIFDLDYPHSLEEFLINEISLVPTTVAHMKKKMKENVSYNQVIFDRWRAPGTEMYISLLCVSGCPLNYGVDWSSLKHYARKVSYYSYLSKIHSKVK